MTEPTLQTRALAVLGPFRGGTSVTCGVLHTLGAFVGKEFWDAGSKYCTYEALGLRYCCNACFDERPAGWCYHGTKEQRIKQLQGWIDFARQAAAARNCVGVGGKHPTLCKLVDEISVAWRTADGRPPILISVARPINEVLSAWEKATDQSGNPWWRRPDRVRVVKDLVKSRDLALQHHDHVTVEFSELRRDPESTIRELAANCELPLTRLQVAIDLVRS